MPFEPASSGPSADLRPRARDFFRPFVFAALLATVALASCSDDPTGPENGGEPNGAGESYNHLLAPGESARDFLADDAFDRLVVQIQYIGEFEPTQGGLQQLQDFLEARLHKKPSGIEIQVDAQPLAVESQETYSAQDVRALEDEHRTAYTEGSTLAAYFLYLDGEWERNADVLGIAYRNTSMALFAETIAENTNGVLQPSPSRTDVEAVVAKHEVGHILGLVDNGTEMQRDHRHENHGPHCENDRCLMYYAVRLGNFLSEFLEGGMPELDEDCLNDLRANGGK